MWSLRFSREASLIGTKQEHIMLPRDKEITLALIEWMRHFKKAKWLRYFNKLAVIVGLFFVIEPLVGNGDKVMAKDDADIAEADFPPLSPAGEQDAPADPSFVSHCLAMLDQLRPIGDIQAGAHSLTLNKTWGLVFRVDFTINKPSDPGFINRMICWKTDSGVFGETYAIGQDIAPLTRN
jgi:hypothetical protein